MLLDRCKVDSIERRVGREKEGNGGGLCAICCGSRKMSTCFAYGNWIMAADPSTTRSGSKGGGIIGQQGVRKNKKKRRRGREEKEGGFNNLSMK